MCFWIAMCCCSTVVFIASVGLVCNKVFNDVTKHSYTDWIAYKQIVVLPDGRCRQRLVNIHPYLFILILSFLSGVLFNYLI